MVLADHQIAARCKMPNVLDNMVTPCVPNQVRVRGERKILSYGLSSYGYDIRIGYDFKIFHNAFGPVIDPKNIDERGFVDIRAHEYVDIPPNSFGLGTSVEYINVPRDLMVICLGKSTYARCGIIINVTPLEPEWRGHITLEISNTTPLPARIWCNEGIGQLIFLRADELCDVSYADRGGKYQNQMNLTLPTV